VARPPIPRRVGCRFAVRGFRPIGRPACTLESVTLSWDGLEALRLADLEGLYQGAAAERMGVSRATFGRIVSRARAVVAEALVEGKVLLLAQEAGVVEVETPAPSCPLHSGGPRRGRGCRCRATTGRQDGGEGP
jgi:uncharacterized protein